MNIRKATALDSHFIFECLKLLIDEDFYTYTEFEKYLDKCLKNTCTEFWIATLDNSQIGLITANKFSVPRYLGFGVEFEEVVIAKPYQGKGYGTSFLNEVINKYKADHNCRKVLIKSNDKEGSCRLYEKVFSKTDFLVFQTYLNKI